AVREVLGDFETVAFLASSYDRSRSGGLVAYRPDDRTLILTPEEQEIRYLIAGRNRPGAAPLWAEAAEQAGDGQLLVAFETPWLVQRLDPSGPRPGRGPVDPIALVGPMLDRAYAYAVSVDVIDGARVGAVALCID